MKMLPRWLPGLLLLGACGWAGVENSQELAAQRAPTPETIIDPGEYEVAWVTEVMEPGVPTRSEAYVGRECVKSGDFRSAEALFLGGLEQCRGDRHVTIKHGQMAATMRCDMEGEPGYDGGFDYRGTYDRTSAQIIGDANLRDGTQRMTQTIKRIGDC